MAEQLICNQQVVGSNPIVGSVLLGILACALVGVRVGIRMLNSLNRLLLDVLSYRLFASGA